ncbi:hypothetical protein FACS18942_05110 [Planctomycetales bacterium]|nr:hypothetical protein FACS18942_05110 [Planctomycetales bacterium]GHT38115.1 hypothetical protein FACS189427_11960 [Planctomycetales bacterium]
MFQGLYNWLKPKGGAKLGYDAAAYSRSRRMRPVSTLSEDKELRPEHRQLLVSEARDLQRNFTLAGFIIRKHLQMVSRFNFESICKPEKDATPERKYEIESFNIALENKIKQWSKRHNCDIAQRHCLSELLEIIETHRVIDGDCGVLKVSGGRLQIIEGDCIRNPIAAEWSGSIPQYPDYEWVHGVKVGRTGRAFKYALNRRMPEGGFQFEREVSSDNLYLTGYFTRSNQIRGISKLAPAITFFSHLYEGIDYALAKAKLSQLLGIFTTHKEDEFDAESADEMPGVEDMRRELMSKFGPEVAHITGRTGDTLELIANNTPSNEFQNFCVMTIRLVFAALDIPYAYFDGSVATYYGNEMSINDYVESSQQKQTDLVELLEELTDWRLREWVASGELLLPSYWTVEDVQYEWIGATLPPWILIKNVKEYLTAVACGFVSPVNICKQHRSNVWRNLEDMQEVFAYAKELGLNLAIDQDKGFTQIGA